jgi:hypothetical protein
MNIYKATWKKNRGVPRGGGGAAPWQNLGLPLKNLLINVKLKQL